MSEAILEAHDLHKAFGGLKALDGVCMSVLRGTISAVIGPNGAGKTTLFNVIAGTLRAERGSIRYSDRELGHLPPHKVARLGIARTFQTTRLFGGLTVAENVLVGRHVRTRSGFLSGMLTLPGARKEQLASSRYAGELLSDFGLAAVAGVPARELPFGQQRLVEIARALATEPGLLLLDEPAAGLNTSETAALARLIRRIRDRGVTVLLVEHDMSLVMDVSDHVVVLSFGRTIAEGEPRDIQRNPAVIDVYLGTDGD